MHFEEYNKHHQNLTEKDVHQFKKLLDEVVRMMVIYLSFETISEGLFEFQLYKSLQKKLDNLLSAFNKKAVQHIDVCVDKHWLISTNKEIRHNGKAIAVNPLKEALEKFKNRPQRLLSERVWNLSGGFRQELEMAIDVAIADGIPASQLASEIKKYLNNPNMLFHRYRDKNGVLQLSKKAAAYHPGQGVYRSSYKNAERLARTEINMAYREADITRWQTLDFVSGYEIKRSKHPYPCKVCDMMQGSYPKTFRWWGNHPNCRCYIVPIFKEEQANVPMNKAFIDWLSENEDKINEANSLPMFLWGVEAPTGNSNAVKSKIQEILKPREKKLFVSFEPFSPVIIDKINKFNNNKQKQKLLAEIVNDQNAKSLFEVGENKVVLFDKHKGIKKDSWENTLQMAKALAQNKRNVAFLPEYDNISSADAITMFRKRYVIADFKHSSTDNYNTIAKDLIKGFSQSDYIVLKMEKGNLDTLRNVVRQVERNGDGMKNLILINKYDKVLELDYKDFLSNKYIRKTKGHL